MVYLSNPDIEMVPGHFALQISTLSWSEVLWGYTNGIIGWWDVIEIAKSADRDITEPMQQVLIYELANVKKDCIWEVSDLLDKLGQPQPADNDAIEKKFLFLCLAWIYTNRKAFINPFDAVELVYADFNYPEEMETFVPFMPQKDNDAVECSYDERIKKMYNNWLRYLQQNEYLKAHNILY